MKKLLSAILIAVNLSVPAFAADITDKHLETLKEFSIFEDVSREAFEDDAFITRAQFCKAAHEIVKWQSGEFSADKAPFSDVPLTHPESEYISLFKEAGIVLGDGEGNFYPDENIKYTEAAKIIVTLLGYEPLAQSRGGYPDGYFAVFNSLSLHEGWDLGVIIDEAAKKKEMAITLANAMDTPVMAVKSYSGDSKEWEYVIMNGKNDTELVTPRIKLHNFDAELRVEK